MLGLGTTRQREQGPDRRWRARAVGHALVRVAPLQGWKLTLSAADLTRAIASLVDRSGRLCTHGA